MRTIAVSLVVVLVLLMVATGPVGGEEHGECNPLGGVDICIEQVEVPESTVKEDQTTEFRIVLRNHGEITGTVRVILGIQRQDKQLYHHIATEEISAGDSVTITEILRAESPGMPEINVLVFNTDESHLYDSTGYETTLMVEESKWNWRESLSTTHVIAGIGASILTIVVFGRRIFGE